MSTWLSQMGLTEEDSWYIHAIARRADDNDQVQKALIARRKGNVAIVGRWDWQGNQMLDYPVRVRDKDNAC